MLFGKQGKEEISLVQKYLKPGMTFYDIGANIGYMSMIAARLTGPDGKIIAFEPYELSRDILIHNVKANNFRNIKIERLAIAEEVGFIDLKHTAELARVSRAQYGDDFVTVECTTLDRYVNDKDVPPPDVIKIDIEGYEIEALEGMLSTLKVYKPVVIVEVHYLGEKFVNFVNENILPMDYIAETADGKNLPKKKYRYQAVLLPNS